MFSQRTTAPATGGLTLNTTSANSLFGNKPSQTPTTSTGSGGLFGALGSTTTATSQPQPGNLFAGLGSTTSQPQGQQPGTTASQAPQSGGLFGGLGSGTSTPQAGSSLFGGQTGAAGQQQQQQTGGLFGGTQPKGPTTGTQFGQSQATASQPQSKSLFGGLGQPSGPSAAAGGLFPTQPQANQQQQSQGPTLSLFANQNAASQQQKPAGSTVVQGVEIDITNLLPTTKFESCSDELKKEIEAIDTFILNQVHMCNEVSDLLPTISAQGTLIPNDVEFVQGKLDALQEALENDANGIEQARGLVKQDAENAKLAFRTIDTLLLPLQYQPATGERWWSASQQPQSVSKRSTFGTRRATLALPEDTEADSNLSSQDGPANLVEYFSRRADDMDAVLQEYRKNLKEIEDHLHGVESSVYKQITDLSASRGRDGAPQKSASQASQLAGALGDVESAILGVAGRLGGVKEEVQEQMLGPLHVHGVRANGW